MWDKVTPADIDEAKRLLRQRSEETLLRHASELRALDAEAAEVLALGSLVEAFVRKHGAGSSGLDPIRAA